jgi:hypothetical protein
MRKLECVFRVTIEHNSDEPFCFAVAAALERLAADPSVRFLTCENGARFDFDYTFSHGKGWAAFEDGRVEEREFPDVVVPIKVCAEWLREL